MSAAAAKRTVFAAVSLLALVAASVAGAGGGSPSGKNRVAPTEPSNFRVKEPTQSTVLVEWDPSQDDVRIAGYYVYGDKGRSTVANPNEVGDVVLTSSYLVKALGCGQSETISVEAFDDDRNRSERVSTTVSTAPCADLQPPTTPSGFRQPATTANSAVLAWDPSTDNVGVVGYGVYRGLDRIASPTESAATLTGLACGSTFQFGVDAIDAAGNRSPIGMAYVQTASCADTQPPSAPTGLSVTSRTATSVSLSWSPSSDDVGVVGYRISLNGTPTTTVSQPAATIGGLTCGSTYTVAVDAFDAAGNRSPATSLTAATSSCPPPPPTTDTTPPSIPGGLAVSNVTQSGLTLSWNASSDNVGVTGYDVSRNGVKVATVSSTSSAQTGLSCATSYTFTVVARDTAGNSSQAAQLVSSTSACSAPPPPADTTPPSQPTNLGISSATATSVTLAWGASSDNVGVAGYRTYVNGSAGSTTSQTSTTASGLSCGTAYTFDVDAYDAAGNRSTRASVIGSTAACPDTQAPTTPTSLVSSSRTATSIAISWSASTDNVGVVGYGLYQGTTLVGTSGSTTGIFSGLTCNTSYTLAVDAYDAAGNRSQKVSTMVSTTACPDTTPPSAPTGLAASNVTQTGLTLSWNASTDNVGVTGYDVYRGGTKTGTATATSSSQSGLGCGTSYDLGVEALDAAGNRSSRSSLTVSTSACPTTTDWTLCASENQRCVFTGTKEVRYGANTTWTSPRTFTDGVDCNNQTFGDPLPGTVKKCEYRGASSTPPPSSPPPSTGFPNSYYSGPAGASIILPSKQGVLVGTAQSGSYAEVEQQITSLESDIGRRLDIEHRFMQGTCSLDAALVDAIVKRGHIPMISWLPDIRNGGAILRGDADSCIRSFGQQIAAQPYKILLRPYWEFNGDWYEHSKDLDGSLLTPDEHKAMWRRSVDRLRESGAFPTASVVWCPGEGHYGNGGSFDEQVAYPGDAYVDWVCADGYNGNSANSWCGAMGSPHTGWCSFREIFHDMLFSGGNVEMDFRGQKPVLIGETGSMEGLSGEKGDWFRKARDDIKANMPGVLGFVYFDIAYTDGDWRIRTSQSSLNGFRDLALDTYFNTR